MKIGIIVFSQTGNTLSVAEQLRNKFTDKGIVSEVIKLSVGSDNKTLILEQLPDLSLYDNYVFASPVQAFSLAVAMSRYLQQINFIEGKKAAIFSTQHFKKAWLGGKRTINQMTALCQLKGIDVIGSSIINWSRADREEQINMSVDKIVNLF